MSDTEGGGSVTAAWARVVAWCEQFAPLSAAGIDPPQPPAAVRAAEAATGQTWPQDLIDWYSVHNGQSYLIWGLIPGSWYTLSLAHVMYQHEARVTLWTTADNGSSQIAVTEAGVWAATFLP